MYFLVLMRYFDCAQYDSCLLFYKIHAFTGMTLVVICHCEGGTTAAICSFYRDCFVTLAMTLIVNNYKTSTCQLTSRGIFYVMVLVQNGNKNVHRFLFYYHQILNGLLKSC